MEDASKENLIIGIDFDKQEFPVRHTCDGENSSPAIHIGRIHSPYLAIIVEDQIGPDYLYNHWLIWDIPAMGEIPANIPKEPAVTRPIAAIQGKNDAGRIGYTGPCPPRGEVHTYYFNVYGLDGPLNLKPGARRAELDRAMQGHMLQYGGQALATYQRR